MNEYHNKKLTGNSKRLRREMTKEERHLWYDFLKTLPLTVHRQKIINSYIVDFYIASEKIVIELDGSQHYEDKEKTKDEIRDQYLRSIGCRILRYSNYEINKQFREVCQDIYNHLSISADKSTSSDLADARPPSPQGEG